MENPRLERFAKLGFDGPARDLKWLVDGSGPPNDLSIFVHRTDATKEDSKYDLVVPGQVFFDDGATSHTHVLTLATPGLCVTLVSHPGLTLKHPMVERGEAWELLHSAPRWGNLRRLRSRSHKYVRYIRGGGVPSGHSVDESAPSFLTGLLDYSEAQQPEPSSRMIGLKRRALKSFNRVRW